MERDETNPTVIIVLTALFVVIAAIVTLALANSPNQRATIKGRTTTAAHTEIHVVDDNTSSAFTPDEHFRAEVRDYGTRYFLRMHRKRMFARDSYTVEVDRATYDRAVVGDTLTPHATYTTGTVRRQSADVSEDSALSIARSWQDKYHVKNIQRVQ